MNSGVKRETARFAHDARSLMAVHPYTETRTESTGRSTDPLLDDLYRSVGQYLNASLRKEPLLTREDVRDLTADVISCIWPRVDDLTHPIRYARRAARNKLIRFLTLKRRRMHLNNDWCTLHQPLEIPRFNLTDHRPVDSCLANKRIEFLRRSMHDEDGRTRLILHLRHGSDMSWPDIANLTGVSPSTARMREQRFRKRVLRAWNANRG